MATTQKAPTPTPYLREWEVAERLINADAGICTRCDKALATWMFHWSDEAPFTTTRGQVNHTQRFSGSRHADGSLCDPDRPDLYTCYARPTCRACGAVDNFDTEQQAWGNQVTCRACGDSNYYSIGD